MTATNKLYRVPGHPVCLSLANHPGKLELKDIQDNLRRAIHNSLDCRENWVQDLLDSWYREGEWGAGATAGNPRRATEEREIEAGVLRLTGAPQLMDRGVYEDLARLLLETAGLGLELSEISSPDEREEAEEAQVMPMSAITAEALPNQIEWD